MNDTQSTTPAAATTSIASPTVMGAGQLLRQYRESAGLHIVALASALKVARAKLEALEADRLDDLPDVVFARALAMSCCRYLGKDAEPVLALMPGHAAQPTPSLRQHLPATHDNAPRPRFTPSRGPFGGPAVPSWVIWALVLLVIVVGGWFAASPQRQVVKPPAAALDFPPQGIPGAEPVAVTQETVPTGGVPPTPGAVPAPILPAVGGATVPVSPGIVPAGNTTTTPVPTPGASTPAGVPAQRVEPVTPVRH